MILILSTEKLILALVIKGLDIYYQRGDLVEIRGSAKTLWGPKGSLQKY